MSEEDKIAEAREQLARKVGDTLGKNRTATGAGMVLVGACIAGSVWRRKAKAAARG